VIAGLITSSFIGVVYFLPVALILCLVKKFKVSNKILHSMGFVWIGSIITVAIVEISKYPPMMMVSTRTVVLVIITTATIISLRIVSKCLIH